MIYTIQSQNLVEINIDNINSDSKEFIGVFKLEEKDKIINKFNLNKNIFIDFENTRFSKFESRSGFDYIVINILNKHNALLPAEKILIYITTDYVLFFSKKTDTLDNMLKSIDNTQPEFISFDRIIYDFLNELTINDVVMFDNIELEIEKLENRVITSQDNNCAKEIIGLRKRLLALKKFYEQLLDILDGIQENENDILNEKTLKLLKIYDKRINRLYSNVINLRDYVTQVREAYQAEVDININQLMKLFTVITTIFLPLSLIAGWYGMNLKMPEFSWTYGYEFVIIVSILVIITSISYFKKNKWL